jgi:hypothetical protein
MDWAAVVVGSRSSCAKPHLFGGARRAAPVADSVDGAVAAAASAIADHCRTHPHDFFTVDFLKKEYFAFV